MHGRVCVWQGCMPGWGACMAGCVCVTRGHAWQRGVHGGMHVRGHVDGGACMAGDHVWQWECVARGMHVGETATEVGGTHPTGMHSCYQL